MPVLFDSINHLDIVPTCYVILFAHVILQCRFVPCTCCPCRFCSCGGSYNPLLLFMMLCYFCFTVICAAVKPHTIGLHTLGNMLVHPNDSMRWRKSNA